MKAPKGLKICLNSQIIKPKYLARFNPQLKLSPQKANQSPNQGVVRLLSQSTTEMIIESDEYKIKELAMTMFAVLKVSKKHSIAKEIFVVLIQKHLKLKSRSVADHYLKELIRLKYVEFSHCDPNSPKSEHYYLFTLLSSCLLTPNFEKCINLHQ